MYRLNQSLAKLVVVEVFTMTKALLNKNDREPLTDLIGLKEFMWNEFIHDGC